MRANWQLKPRKPPSSQHDLPCLQDQSQIARATSSRRRCTGASSRQSRVCGVCGLARRAVQSAEEQGTKSTLKIRHVALLGTRFFRSVANQRPLAVGFFALRPAPALLRAAQRFLRVLPSKSLFGSILGFATRAARKSQAEPKEKLRFCLIRSS